MSVALLAKTPFELKSHTWILTALRLHTVDAALLAAELDARFADSPGLFDDEAVVVDLGALPEDQAEAELDWPALLAALRHHGMRPVGVQGGSAAQRAAAREAGLAEAGEAEPRREPRIQPAITLTEPALPPVEAAPAADAVEAVPEPQAAAQAPALPARLPTMVVDKPLRSGQRVYARGADLVVLSVVSFGAEVIADGHIHVYAPLRGRAIAGARGNTEARIFSTCMEPQLVSIAGIYRTTETPLPPGVTGHPAQVRLEGESLIVEPLRA
ncbi:putative septum site-determining protein MinC [Rubrivivax sp. A210]|uniref:septum site-determining protein MinC n=1 Tax=Rubrivivax sp. A210 TaxID=2772301 RepID=UPI00191A006A|nr:septum site-determining protein MinC [Rubrivivax sp. A210]CAD5374270.1 putative septum site-determining protein MinC [Rubrivivax sp. A210]